MSVTKLSDALPLVLLFLFFAQTVLAMPQLSLTADEPVYMAQGYVLWTRWDFRFAEMVAQPPLPSLLAGIGLLLQPGPIPEALEGWMGSEHSRFVHAFLHWYGPGSALNAATFVARLPIALVALIGAAFVYRWARECFGQKAGLLALTLFAFDPNLIAHSGLATTDVLLTVWSFIAVYAAIRWTQTLRGKWMVLSSLAAGLALASKTSGFFPLGIIALLLFADTVEKSRSESFLRSSLRSARMFASITLIALLTLWALYRFETRPFPLATQLLLWQSLRRHMAEGHAAFLMGEVSHQGWWYYYPIAFLLKTPIPTMVLIGAAIAKNGRSLRRWWQDRDLWLFPFLYGCITLTSTIAIGYRYLLPILPFLFVLAGRVLTPSPNSPPPTSRPPAPRFHVLRLHFLRPYVLRFTPPLLLAWLLLSTLSLFPHHLTYFNELAGGPYGGHRYLVDSNLDWGQSFIALRRWLETRPELAGEPLNISFYTYADPSLYGITYRSYYPAISGNEGLPILPARFNPPPGIYVLSATTRQGVMVGETDNFDWFRHREPIARPGIALFVYQVLPQEPPPTWAAQCTIPVAPLSPEAAAEGFGRNDLRTAYFDCTQAWLYPTGGQEPGWYIFYRETVRSKDDFIRRHLGSAPLSYEQRRPGALPPFAIYEQPADRPPTWRFSPPNPIQVGNLTFLGYDHGGFPVQPGKMLEIETWWKVEEVSARPLSVMMHLIGPDGTFVAGGDGLGVPVDQWKPGDIIVQRHRLPIPADAPPGAYSPLTGVYWLDTMERWPVEINGQPAGNHIPLPAVVVLQK